MQSYYNSCVVFDVVKGRLNCVDCVLQCYTFSFEIAADFDVTVRHTNVSGLHSLSLQKHCVKSLDVFIALKLVF